VSTEPTTVCYKDLTMDIRRFGTGVRRVTVLERDAADHLHPVTIYSRRGRRKRQTKGLKPFERLARTAAKAGNSFSATYRRRHRRSNEKRKDGWLRDGVANLAKAGDRARKKLDVVRLLGW
jgi:hypothetical protein